MRSLAFAFCLSLLAQPLFAGPRLALPQLKGALENPGQVFDNAPVEGEPVKREDSEGGVELEPESESDQEPSAALAPAMTADEESSPLKGTMPRLRADVLAIVEHDECEGFLLCLGSALASPVLTPAKTASAGYELLAYEDDVESSPWTGVAGAALGLLGGVLLAPVTLTTGVGKAFSGLLDWALD